MTRLEISLYYNSKKGHSAHSILRDTTLIEKVSSAIYLIAVRTLNHVDVTAHVLKSIRIARVL
jgi:hypothetical protein